MDKRIMLDRYRLVDVVRTQGLATTYSAVDEQENRAVALKLVPTPPGNPNHLPREFEIGSRLSHRNLLRYHGCFHTESHTGLVTELVHGDSFLASGQQESLEGHAARVFCELCNVVEYLHGENLIHGNLTPDVILWTSSSVLKLIDLGHCEERMAERAFWHAGFHGTPNYSSPEHSRGRLAPESDYLAVGILLFEHLTGRNPLRPVRPGACLDEITKIDEGVSAQADVELVRAPSRLRHSIKSLLSTSLEARRSGWSELRGFLEAST